MFIGSVSLKLLYKTMSDVAKHFNIRLIEPNDNKGVKTLVIDTLAEFGLVGVGYAGVDPEMDDMYAAYNNTLSAYYVVEVAGEIEGVGGFAPLVGTEPGTVAELRKMYLSSRLRGQGLGQKLLDLCIQGAQQRNYSTMYLETVPIMKSAQSMYLRNGFEYLDGRLGDTGHSGCHVNMQRRLND